MMNAAPLPMRALRLLSIITETGNESHPTLRDVSIFSSITALFYNNFIYFIPTLHINGYPTFWVRAITKLKMSDFFFLK